MRSTFKVLFYVKKGSEKPNGNLPLMCRITVDGEIKQFSCKMDVPPRLWDVKNLTAGRLQIFFDGNLWIITRRKKTNTESNIRLLDVPKRIIEKYKGLARDGHVFPVPSNGSCNKILKDIGRQCGFKVRLTYHVARHTNATTVLLSHGVPIETVSRLLGHTNIKTTQIYAKITAQKISQDMETLSHKLEDMEKNICRAI